MQLSVNNSEKIFNNYQQTKKFSEKTRYKSKYCLRFFVRYLIKINKLDLREVNSNDILKYFDYLLTYLKPNGKCLKNVSRMGLFYPIKGFFKYLYQMEYILINPFDGVNFKLQKDGIERKIFTVREMDFFLEGIKSNDKEIQVRDRAMFELLYITGCRPGELSKLDVTDIDLKKDEMFIKNAKGYKDRIIPIGRVAKEYLLIYLKHYRNKYLRKNREEKALFLSKRNKQRISVYCLHNQFKKYKDIAGIKKKVVLYSIRHTCATHLLEGGADINYVKKLLGHSSLETTAGYTHLLIESRRKIVKKYHPRENEMYEEVPLDLRSKLKAMMQTYQRKAIYW